MNLCFIEKLEKIFEITGSKYFTYKDKKPKNPLPIQNKALTFQIARELEKGQQKADREKRRVTQHAQMKKEKSKLRKGTP